MGTCHTQVRGPNDYCVPGSFRRDTLDILFSVHPLPPLGKKPLVKEGAPSPALALADSQAIISVCEELDLDTHDASLIVPRPRVGRISPLHCVDGPSSLRPAPRGSQWLRRGSRWNLKSCLNEDLKLGSRVGRAGSPFSGRWASTTALPKPATKRFIHSYAPGWGGGGGLASLLLSSVRLFIFFANIFRFLTEVCGPPAPRLEEASARCYTNATRFRDFCNKCHCGRPVDLRSVLYRWCTLGEYGKKGVHR